MFKQEYFKRTPKWKMFFIRILGEQIVSVDGQKALVYYKFRHNLYFDRVMNGYIIVDDMPKYFTFSKVCNPNKWE